MKIQKKKLQVYSGFETIDVGVCTPPFRRPCQARILDLLLKEAGNQLGHLFINEMCFQNRRA